MLQRCHFLFDADLRLFWHPVDPSEIKYYEETENPICLSQVRFIHI